MSFADVTIITPTIRDRYNDYLPRCMNSVANQTVRPKAHLIGADLERATHPVVVNRLAESVKTKWLMILNDDDFLYSNCLQQLLAYEGQGNVIYPDANLGSWPEDHPIHQAVNRPVVKGQLSRENPIAGAALVITEAFLEVGGYDEQDTQNSDWIFWGKLAESGNGFFVHVPEVLWYYQCHGDQMTALVDNRRT